MKNLRQGELSERTPADTQRYASFLNDCLKTGTHAPFLTNWKLNRAKCQFKTSIISYF